jgi:hypothetical protein
MVNSAGRRVLRGSSVSAYSSDRKITDGSLETAANLPFGVSGRFAVLNDEAVYRRSEW